MSNWKFSCENVTENQEGCPNRIYRSLSRDRGDTTLRLMDIHPKCGRRRRVGLGVAVLLFASPWLAGAQSPTAGPERGAVVPEFEAVDQSGESREFKDLTGENGLLLLFFRSADW